MLKLWAQARGQLGCRNADNSRPAIQSGLGLSRLLGWNTQQETQSDCSYRRLTIVWMTFRVYLGSGFWVVDLELNGLG